MHVVHMLIKCRAEQEQQSVPAEQYEPKAIFRLYQSYLLFNWMTVNKKTTFNLFVLRAATFQQGSEGNSMNSVWRGWFTLYKMDAFFV